MGTVDHIKTIEEKTKDLVAELEVYAADKNQLYTNGLLQNNSYANTPNLYKALNNYAYDIYKELNLSAIEGEYVTNSVIEEKLKHILIEVKNLLIYIPDQDPFKLESQKLLPIVRTLTNDIEQYCFQIHFFQKSITTPDATLLDFESTYTEKQTTDSTTENYSEVFKLNLRLLFVDRVFPLANKQFYEIHGISHRLKCLKDKVAESYVEALIHKCAILENKFYYKKGIEQILSYYTFYKSEDEQIDLRLNETGYVSQKQRELNTRDSEKYEYNIRRYYSELKDHTSSFYYFIACHYYKDIRKDEALLESLSEEFIISSKNLTYDFDKYNAEVCKGYLKNCLFSLRLKKNKDNVNSVENELKSISALQGCSNVTNYFPYFKAAHWYRSLIDDNINNNQVNKDTLSYVDRFSSLLDKIDEKLRQRERNASSFIPFRPYYKECIEEFKSSKDEEISIFISTSFVIPVDYEAVRNDINVLKSDLIRQRAIVESSLNIQKVLADINKVKSDCEQSIQDAKTETKDDLKENQRSSIQILAIFAGIVLFASGTIQIFTGATCIKDATIFMLMFAASLGILSLLVRNCIITQKEWNTRDKVYLAAQTIIVILSCLAIFCPWGQEQINRTQENEGKHTNNTESVVDEPLIIDVETNDSSVREKFL